MRPQEADKGTAAKDLLSGADPAERVVAIGDDRSDEDLFRAADGASTFAASPLPTHAHFRVAGPDAVRALLGYFIERRRARAANEKSATRAEPTP